MSTQIILKTDKNPIFDQIKSNDNEPDVEIIPVTPTLQKKMDSIASLI